MIGKIVKVTQAHHEKDEPDNSAGDVIVVCHGRKSSFHPVSHLRRRTADLSTHVDLAINPYRLPIYPRRRHVALPDRAVVRAALDGRPPVRGRPGRDHRPRIHPPHLRRASNAGHELVRLSRAVSSRAERGVRTLMLIASAYTQLRDRRSDDDIGKSTPSHVAKSARPQSIAQLTPVLAVGRSNSRLSIMRERELRLGQHAQHAPN